MAKPKSVNWQLLDNDNEIYTFVSDLVEKYHGGDKGIEGVNFILMWRHNVKMDRDGYVVLADITKSSDKMRELRPHDLVIGINKDAWSVLDDIHKSVIIDCQLERIAICLDKEDNPKEDDRSRIMYRLKRPEVLDEETLKRRHGINMQEVQEIIYKKFTTGDAGDAEEGSYIANQLESE